MGLSRVPPPRSAADTSPSTSVEHLEARCDTSRLESVWNGVTAGVTASTRAVTIILHGEAVPGYAELRVLHELRRDLRRSGISVTVECGDPPVRRMLALLGLTTPATPATPTP